MDIRQLDLNLLSLLDAMHRERNLSHVARQLGMSQPRASAALAALRGFFGDELYVRTGRGMRPTPRAEELAAPIAQVLATIHTTILRKTAFLPADSDRTFNITTSDIGVLVFVPPILQALRELAPSASLRCVPVAHEDLEGALEQGTIDLAVGYFPDLRGSSVRAELLFRHPFACIVRHDHPDIDDTLSLAQFLAAEHLVVSQEGRSQEIFERRMRQMRLERRIVLQLPHFMSVPQLVASSDLIATVPRSLGDWYRSAGIKVLEPPMDIPLIELRQHWHRRRQNDPAVAWLRTLVTKQLSGRDASLAFTPEYAQLKGRKPRAARRRARA